MSWNKAHDTDMEFNYILQPLSFRWKCFDAVLCRDSVILSQWFVTLYRIVKILLLLPFISLSFFFIVDSIVIGHGCVHDLKFPDANFRACIVTNLSATEQWIACRLEKKLSHSRNILMKNEVMRSCTQSHRRTHNYKQS